jgi:hypothetical protein
MAWVDGERHTLFRMRVVFNDKEAGGGAFATVAGCDACSKLVGLTEGDLRVLRVSPAGSDCQRIRPGCI